jgi:hypothetical protein
MVDVLPYGTDIPVVSSHSWMKLRILLTPL